MRRPTPPLASANAISWHDYETPCVSVYIYGPQGGKRGGGELDLEQAKQLRDQLIKGIEEVEVELNART